MSNKKWFWLSSDTARRNVYERKQREWKGMMELYKEDREMAGKKEIEVEEPLN